MNKVIELTPLQRSLADQRLKLEVHLQEQNCIVYNGNQEVVYTFPLAKVDEIIKMPDFTGQHKWPIFNIAGKSQEFKVDNSGLRYLKDLRVMCFSLKDKSHIKKLLRNNSLWLFTPVSSARTQLTLSPRKCLIHAY